MIDFVDDFLCTSHIFCFELITFRISSAFAVRIQTEDVWQAWI